MITSIFRRHKKVARTRARDAARTGIASARFGRTETCRE